MSLTLSFRSFRAAAVTLSIRIRFSVTTEFAIGLVDSASSSSSVSTSGMTIVKLSRTVSPLKSETSPVSGSYAMPSA